MAQTAPYSFSVLVIQYETSDHQGKLQPLFSRTLNLSPMSLSKAFNLCPIELYRTHITL